MSGIFISYRRQDSAAYAGRLYDRLAAHFGADQVFMDVDDIPPGADFVSHLDARVGACDVMVVVIGRNWLAARNAEGQLRLSDPNDFVALEVATALRRGVLVVPVLVGGAQMPRAEDLRDDLKALARRNALTVDDRDFQRDVGDLIRAIETDSSIRKRPVAAADSRAQLRRKLFRRLIWKVPAIVLLVSFAVWWEARKEQAMDAMIESASAGLTGAWAGEVTYGWGAKYKEVFFFQPEGGKLFGTASFLGVKRGIEEGRIEGDNIAFFVRYQEISGDETRERKNYYWGKWTGDKIHMRLQDDRGSPAVEWDLTRSQAPR